MNLVQTRINRNGLEEVQERFVEDNVSAYAKLDSLLEFKRELFGEEEVRVELEEVGYDISQIDISQYQTFHRSNSNAERWLSTLIDTGKLTVGGHEHWSSGSKERGARGGSIVKKMRYNIISIFSDLGLGRPKVDINYATRTLEISEEVSEVLGDIRDQVYALQRNGAARI